MTQREEQKQGQDIIQGEQTNMNMENSNDTMSGKLEDQTNTDFNNDQNENKNVETLGE